jgi:hypothetical protein
LLKKQSYCGAAEHFQFVVKKGMFLACELRNMCDDTKYKKYKQCCIFTTNGVRGGRIKRRAIAPALTAVDGSWPGFSAAQAAAGKITLSRSAAVSGPAPPTLR